MAFCMIKAYGLAMVQTPPPTYENIWYTVTINTSSRVPLKYPSIPLLEKRDLLICFYSSRATLTSTDQSVLRTAIDAERSWSRTCGVIYTQEDDSYYTISLYSTLELKAGNQVSINIHSASAEAFLYDDDGHYTHFTGHLLQENVTSSLNHRRSFFKIYI